MECDFDRFCTLCQIKCLPVLRGSIFVIGEDRLLHVVVYRVLYVMKEDFGSVLIRVACMKECLIFFSGCFAERCNVNRLAADFNLLAIRIDGEGPIFRLLLFLLFGFIGEGDLDRVSVFCQVKGLVAAIYRIFVVGEDRLLHVFFRDVLHIMKLDFIAVLIAIRSAGQNLTFLSSFLADGTDVLRLLTDFNLRTICVDFDRFIDHFSLFFFRLFFL